MSFGKNRLLLGGFILLLIAIPLVVTLLQRQQENRSKAAQSTTLSFTPVSTTTSPIQKNVGDPLSLDIMVNPGTNLPSLVKLEIMYDQDILEPAATNAFVANNQVFPVTLEGPILTIPGKILVSLSIGGDPTKALQTIGRAGTVNLRLKAAGSGQVSFGPLTQVYSVGAQDEGSENVLSSTTPAFFTTGTNGLTPTLTVTVTPNITRSPTPAPPVATNTPIPTPTLIPGGARLQLSILLHGVGNSGDNQNPNGHSSSNKNPVNPQRNINVLVYDSVNELVVTTIGTINYSRTSGSFTGIVDLGTDFINGNYNVKIKTDKYLRRLRGILQISKDQTTEVPQFAMVAGDINSDNALNILDYAILLDCGYGSINPLPMSDPNSEFLSLECQSHEHRKNSDLNDSGIIDSYDYNLFIRELSVQNGD